MMNNMIFNNNSNSLIQRQQNYVLDRKLVTFHSEDRDINKWNNSNHFEVHLPDTLTNIESLRLVQCDLPINYDVFNTNYQNTKLSLEITTKNPAKTYYNTLSGGVEFTITIQDGFYSPQELANEIQERINDTVTSYIIDAGISDTYSSMKVYYDRVGQRYWFGNDEDEFILLFDKQELYTLSNCEQPNMWEKYVKWGLPSYLGFNREEYSAISSSTNIKFNYLGVSGTWLTPASGSLPVYYVTAPLTPFILGERIIYMEVDKYNSYDELVPFSEATNNMYNNDYNGKKNSAFAKIPVQNVPLGELVDSRNGFLQNISYYNPPIEKISRLEFKFRYHDGRLVEFGNNPFSFTIEFNQLRNEIGKSYNVRVPTIFGL